MLGLRVDSKQRYGCIFFKSIAPGPSLNAGCAIDFWTSRVGEIDTSNLPAAVGQVMVWDDLFAKRQLKKAKLDVLHAIPEHFICAGPRVDAYRLLLDPFDDLCGIIEDLLKDPRFGVASRRMAIVNLGSAGVGALQWCDILPCLRSSYDLVIGLDSILGKGFADHDSFFNDFDEENYWSGRSPEILPVRPYFTHERRSSWIQ